MKIIPGQQAPNFSLYDSDKNKITLSDLKGHNVLLLFFPAAFTGTCTKELCSVRDNIGLYDNADAKVFGISVDMIYSLAKYKEEQNLNFSLLSDFNKEVSTAYGCLYDTFSYDMKGVSKRAAFIIDQNGIVQYAEVLERATDLPNFNVLQKILQSLH
ncbi:MAG TPA: redoxin domain-containing protein [Chitinophagaceae bacterium]|jgi:glutaredoxin-dependent peroxiredoxin|nr:redoxin domain-containing protein [Chitinophagaceae bacterium]